MATAQLYAPPSRPRLHVSLEDAAEPPAARVPTHMLWDLVEYLSYQRIAVTYDFHATHFIVRFPRSTLASAQQVLDDWTNTFSHGSE